MKGTPTHLLQTSTVDHVIKKPILRHICIEQYDADNNTSRPTARILMHVDAAAYFN